MRIAALQMRSGTEPEANLDALEALVAEAAGQGAGYVLSPEVTIAMAEGVEGLRRVAQPWEGNAAIARAAAMARRHGVVLHLGSLAVALPDGRFANRSVLFRPDGAVLATYDKIHLFDATLPGLAAYRESETYAPGRTAVVTPAAGMLLGLSVCYDVRFAALYRALAEAGAEVLAVPAAFTAPTGAAHWETLLRARAIETGCYVIAAAQGGLHQNGRKTWGHSMVVDPWGAIIAELPHDEPGVLVADIELAAVRAARDKVPALDNARQFSLSVNHSAAPSGQHRDSVA